MQRCDKTPKNTQDHTNIEEGVVLNSESFSPLFPYSCAFVVLVFCELLALVIFVTVKPPFT